VGSPADFAKLANFESALRKPLLVPFGLFNAQDNLGFIASISQSSQLTTFSASYASSLILDTSSADVITVLLTGNVASLTLTYVGSSSIPTGQRVWLRLLQDSTGGRTVSLPASLLADSGFAIDPTANRATVLPIQWNGSHWIFFEAPFSVPLE